MTKVLIVQSQMKQYRVPFFEKLHAALVQDGITLRVAYSDPPPSEARKGDNQDLSAEYGVKVKGIWACGEKAVYQPLLREALAADLIIVEQANKHLLNYLLLFLSALGIKKVAYWGHGRNRQRQGQNVLERLKKRTLNCVDGWFAYTDGTARYLIENGVPPLKITSVQNAIDTKELRRQCAGISQEEIDAARNKLGISAAAKVGLFCAGITREKLPGFLIDAARQIRRSLPDFELLVIGAGPEQDVIETAARDTAWIHYLGSKFGREKAIYFRLASAFLVPGVMGLAILDAFSAGLPVVTSEVPRHGPEIEYLVEGRNGIMTAVDPGAYGEAVIRLLSDEKMLCQLKEGALASSEKYTVEEMVERFRSGVLQYLGGTAKASGLERGWLDGPTR